MSVYVCVCVFNMCSIFVCRSVAQCHDRLETCRCIEVVRVYEYRTSKIDIHLSVCMCVDLESLYVRAL